VSIQLEAVGLAARSAWEAALGPDAVIAQTPAWMACVCASGRWEDATRVYQADDGRLLVLPLARMRQLPSVAAVEGSMPQDWGAGGLLCADGVTAADVRAVVADLRARRALRTLVCPRPRAVDAWAAAVDGGVVKTPRMEQTLDLAGGFDTVWSERFTRKVRSWHRKAEQRVTVTWDDSGLLVPVFDALYRRSVERWARMQHEPLPLARLRARRREPVAKFTAVAEGLGPACRVGVAYREGEPAAAIVVLAHGDHATYWRGAMDRELAAGTGANELLHVLAIEHACAHGRRFYHLGQSAPGSSLARFKRGFGAEEEHAAAFAFERLPLTAAQTAVKDRVKALVGFRD